MTKAVYNRGICFIRVVLVRCEHGQVSLYSASLGLTCPLPNTVRVKYMLYLDKGVVKCFFIKKFADN